MSVHGAGYVNPAKSFLERYSALSIQLEIMRREVMRQRDSLTNITAHLKDDVVQTSGAGDRMADGVARIVDAENQFAEEAARIVKAQTEILEAINSVKDETQKAVLMLRYIERLGWIGVQERIGYEKTQTLVIHGRALLEINKWLEKKRAD